MNHLFAFFTFMGTNEHETAYLYTTKMKNRNNEFTYGMSLPAATCNIGAPRSCSNNKSEFWYIPLLIGR